MRTDEALEVAGRHQQGMATRSQLTAAGLTRRVLQAAVRDGRLVRLRRGVYAAGPLAPVGRHLLSAGECDPAYVARVRAVLLSLGHGAAAARRTAAVLWGFDLLVEPTEVEVDVAPGRSRVRLPGVEVRRRRLDDVVPVRPVAGAGPVPVTSAVATVTACALDLPLREAVAVGDSALRRRACTLAELRRAVRARRGAPGAARLRRVVRRLDPRSGSVLESVLRVLLREAGLARPQAQYVVVDEGGRFVARVDLCWPDARLVLEADGRRWHDPVDARDADRRRSNACAGLGWRVLRVTWAQVVHDGAAVVELVRRALAAAAA